jgi:hypothetical protein|tara:strand:- start:134 stop:376 length:243 start_codon:yes stop_codon:yes gene_type:complete
MSFKVGYIETGMVDLKRDLPSLSIEELHFLLTFIGESEFKGKDMQRVVTLTQKLDTMYQNQIVINQEQEQFNLKNIIRKR